MTVTALKASPKVSSRPRQAPPPPVQAVPPAPPAAPSRRRGFTPLTPMRVQAAKSMTKLADHMKETHPDMLAHQHVRDAARMLRSGNEEAAQRHLRAAMFAMTPQSLMRNGLHTDDDHIAARDAMHGIHRHLLLTKDIADTAAKNQAAIRRDSYGDDASSPPMPQSPVHADPNAGYGPGALAQKPTARQPPGDRALNAPNRAGTGKPDPNVADPVGPQPKGSKQFTTRNGVRAVTELAYDWDDIASVIDLVGPHGFEHGFIYVGGPGLPSVAQHDAKGGTGATVKPKVGDDMPSKGFSQPGGLKASKLKAGDKVMGSYSGGAAGLKMHDVTGVKHQTTITVRNTRTGAVHTQKINSASKRDDGKAFGQTKAGDKIQGHYRGDPLGKTDEYEVTKAKHETTLKTADPDTGEEHTQTLNSNGNVRMSRAISRISAASARTQAAGNAKRAATRAASKASAPLSNVYGSGTYEFSAKTAALEVTPAPYGKPGGPGLYGVHGLTHTPYYQQVVKALREKRGMDKATASKVAYGALRKWAAGGGNVHPEVSAAAGAALAGEKAIGAAAKAVHGHANSWDEVADRVLELAAVSPAGTPAQPRVPAGQAGGGQFGSGGQAQQQQAGAKSIASQTASKNVKAKIAANQQAKNKLLTQAAGYRAQADKLIAQRKVLQAELASASGATSSGQSGSTTSAGSSTTSSGSSTTASTAPATTSTAASTTPASTASTTASTSTALTSAQTAQINAQIGQLTTQIVAYQKQYAQAMAQAAKL